MRNLKKWIRRKRTSQHGSHPRKSQGIQENVLVNLLMQVFDEAGVREAEVFTPGRKIVEGLAE